MVQQLSSRLIDSTGVGLLVLDEVQCELDETQKKEAEAYLLNYLSDTLEVDDSSPVSEQVRVFKAALHEAIHKGLDQSIDGCLENEFETAGDLRVLDAIHRWEQWLGIGENESFSVKFSDVDFDDPDGVQKVAVYVKMLHTKAIAEQPAGEKPEDSALWPYYFGMKAEEVYRHRCVRVIGDLSGKYAKFSQTVTGGSPALVVREGGELKWTGGNTKMVFVGDILGDRSSQGYKIYAALYDLREQARAQGGDIEVLMGNHEKITLAFNLDWQVIAEPNGELHQPFHIGHGNVHSKGKTTHVRALLDYSGISEQSFHERAAIPEWKLQEVNSQWRYNLSNAEEGSQEWKMWQMITSMKLCSREGDVWVQHVPPSDKNMPNLLNGMADTEFVNHAFQEMIRGNDVPVIIRDYVMKVMFNTTWVSFRDSWLKNQNETTPKRNRMNLAQHSGIHFIAHGHHPQYFSNADRLGMEAVYESHGVWVLPTDLRGAPSIGEIRTDGSCWVGLPDQCR